MTTTMPDPTTDSTSTAAATEQQHDATPRWTQSDFEFAAAEQDRERLDQVAATVQAQYTGFRVRISGLPQSRKVSSEQRAAAASQFGADPDSVSMSSRLWDANEPAVKKIRSVLAKVSRLFHDRRYTLPTTEAGVRLLRRDRISDYESQMTDFLEELRDALEEFDREMPAIVERERGRRGELFDETSYAFNPLLTCKLSWGFPVTDPNENLQAINDEIYAREVRRIQEELRETVKMAEAQIAEDLYESVAGLAEKLAEMNAESDTKKVLQTRTLSKLFDGLENLQQQVSATGLGDTTELQRIGSEMQALLANHTDSSLRSRLANSRSRREDMQEKCAQLADKILKTAVPKTRRQVIGRI